MAVNKNFVVKNGLEVNTRLILADANTNKVGIGSTGPRFELDVAGGIGATDSYVTGVSTVITRFSVGEGGNTLTGVGGSVGVGTAIPQYLLDIRSPVSTGQTALYVQGDIRITGDLNVDDVVLDDASINNLTVVEALNVASSGISTFGGYVDINDSLDISTNLNVVGLTTLGGYVDINNNVDISGTVNIAGITTISNTTDSTTYNNGALVIDGGLGVEKSVHIGGDLDVTGNVYIGGTTVTLRGTDVFIENKDIVLGYTTTITPNDDTANHAGIAIASTEGSPLVSFSVSGINTLPDTYKQMMWFRSGTLGFSTDVFAFNYGVAVGTTTVVDGVRLAVGSEVRITDDTINTINLNVNGIVTSTSGVTTYYGDGQYLSLDNNSYLGIGIGTTAGVVGYGITFLDLKGAGVSTTQYNPSTGIATIFFEGGGSGTIGIGTEFPTSPSPSNGDLFYNADYGRIFVYYDENIIGVGTDEYWVDAAPFNLGVLDIGDLSVANLTITNNTNSSGIITAVSFFGDGSGLTGTGSTVFNDTTTNQEFFPLFTSITSGTIISSGISTTKLTYNPFNGEMTAINFNSTSDQKLKTNIQTVENALDITDQLRGVSFDWKENGIKSYGVIAQELEEILPELVKNGEVKSVNYNGIIGVLIEAIKELKKEIEILKTYK